MPFKLTLFFQVKQTHVEVSKGNFFMSKNKDS